MPRIKDKQRTSDTEGKNTRHDARKMMRPRQDSAFSRGSKPFQSGNAAAVKYYARTRVQYA